MIQGNIKLLLDDIAQLKPTVFPSVPRVLNKLHDRIMEGIGQKPAFVQWLIGKATNSKLAEVRVHCDVFLDFWHRSTHIFNSSLRL